MSTELTKELFEDVVVFFFSEPGAMGPNDMSFFKKNGESFSVDYLSGYTPYSMLKEVFPVLQECYWNGPAKNEAASLLTIVIGRSENDRETCVATGWKHIYLDFGNHLAVKEELYDEVLRIFEGIDNCEITFDWIKILEKTEFHKRIAV